MHYKKWLFFLCIASTNSILSMRKEQIVKLGYGTYQLTLEQPTIQEQKETFPQEETSCLSSCKGPLCSSTKTLCIALGSSLCGSGFIGAGVYALSHNELAGSIFLLLIGSSIVAGSWYTPIKNIYNWCANN